MPESRAFFTIDAFIAYLGTEPKTFGAFEYHGNKTVLVSVEYNPDNDGLRIISQMGGNVLKEVSCIRDWGINQKSNQVDFNYGAEDFFTLYTAELSLRNLR